MGAQSLIRRPRTLHPTGEVAAMWSSPRTGPLYAMQDGAKTLARIWEPA